MDMFPVKPWAEPVAFRSREVGRRGAQNVVSSQTRIQYVRTEAQLLEAIQRAQFAGVIPREGLGQVALLGTAIVIVEPIKFSSTIEIPTRAIGLTITAPAKFSNFAEHTGPIFRLRSVSTTISDLLVTRPSSATDGPSHFVELAAATDGSGAANTELRNCFAYADALIATAAGVDSQGTQVIGNRYVDPDAVEGGINIVGDDTLVAHNMAGSNCPVTFGPSSSRRVCIGNILDGGTVTNADVDVGNI